MSVTVQETNGQLICIKPNHNELIIMVALNEKNPSDQLLCSKCIKGRDGIVNVIGVEKAKQLIYEKSKKSVELRVKHLSILNQISEEMDQKFAAALFVLNEMKRIITSWKGLLTGKQTQLENLIEGIKLLQDGEEDPKIKGINLLRYFFLGKENFLLNKLFRVLNIEIIFNLFKQLTGYDGDINDFQRKYQNSNRYHHNNYQPGFFGSGIINYLETMTNLNSTPNHIVSQISPYSQPELLKLQVLNQKNISKVQLINSVKQPEWSYAMAFNITGSIIIAGSNKDIKVWKFSSGKLTEQQRLTKHQGDVLCLAFSKKLNLFISGSNDHTVICWRERINGEWDSKDPVKQHKNVVICILINKNEDQVLSCSWDNTIIVSQLNCEENSLQYFYTLEEKYSQKICCISFNQSETRLVSCNHSRQIILWIQNQERKWVFQNEINGYDFGNRISFINDHQIIFQPQSHGLVLMFEVIGEKLVRKQEYDLKLGEYSTDGFLFPTIVNYQRNIIIQRYNQFVYILKQQENGFLELASLPIDCLDSCNFGDLSFDGEFLIIWNYTSKAFRIYKISYQ